jgi:hypothetical protein
MPSVWSGMRHAFEMPDQQAISAEETWARKRKQRANHRHMLASWREMID